MSCICNNLILFCFQKNICCVLNKKGKFVIQSLEAKIEKERKERQKGKEKGRREERKDREALEGTKSKEKSCDER